MNLTRRQSIATILASLGAARFVRASVPWAVTQREADVPLASKAMLHRFTVTGDDSVDFTIAQFHSAHCTLRIVDQEKPTARSLRRVMPEIGAVAATNGGFFTPEFQPLGLVIANGKRIGAWQRSSLLGGVVMVRKGKPLLLWRDEYQSSDGVTELLQAGPRLVNNGKAITGLETKSRRPRSFIATDNNGQWLLGTGEYCTLTELAQILATPGLVPGMEIARALNFDGGKSTGFWARTETGEVISDSEITTVRNFVAVVPKKQ